MILIDGKKAAAELREELKQEVSQLKSKYNKVPGLTVILIGDLTPSQIYVRNKEKSANEVGLKSEVIRYPDDRLPTFIGCKPSTSLCGEIVSITCCLLICLGNGN